jgi:hypothetical protein
MPLLRLEDILRPTTTPEQANLLNWFYSQFNKGSNVAHRTIINVEPLYYQGPVGIAEFLVYVNTKLYICYNFVASFSGSTIGGSITKVRFFDENSNDSLFLLGNALSYDIVNSIKLLESNTMSMNNFYFANCQYFGYDMILFNGYRITLN